MDARLAGIRSDAGRNRAAEPRSRRVSEGGGLDAILWRGQRGTAGNDHHKRDQQGGQNAVHLSVTDRCCEDRFPRNPALLGTVLVAHHAFHVPMLVPVYRFLGRSPSAQSQLTHARSR